MRLLDYRGIRRACATMCCARPACCSRAFLGGGGGRDVLEGGVGGSGWDTPPPRVPLWSPPKAGHTPLGTEGAEAKFWLSASNIGRGGGGGGGGYPPPPTVYGHFKTSLRGSVWEDTGTLGHGEGGGGHQGRIDLPLSTPGAFERRGGGSWRSPLLTQPRAFAL